MNQSQSLHVLAFSSSHLLPVCCHLSSFLVGGAGEGRATIPSLNQGRFRWQPQKGTTTHTPTKGRPSHPFLLFLPPSSLCVCCTIQGVGAVALSLPPLKKSLSSFLFVVMYKPHINKINYRTHEPTGCEETHTWIIRQLPAGPHAPPHTRRLLSLSPSSFKTYTPSLHPLPENLQDTGWVDTRHRQGHIVQTHKKRREEEERDLHPDAWLGTASNENLYSPPPPLPFLA